MVNVWIIVDDLRNGWYIGYETFIDRIEIKSRVFGSRVKRKYFRIFKLGWWALRVDITCKFSQLSIDLCKQRLYAEQNIRVIFRFSIQHGQFTFSIKCMIAWLFQLCHTTRNAHFMRCALDLLKLNNNSWTEITVAVYFYQCYAINSPQYASMYNISRCALYLHMRHITCERSVFHNMCAVCVSKCKLNHTI